MRTGAVSGRRVIARDTFTDTNGTTLQNHVADSGQSWTKHSAAAADASIDNGLLHNANTANAPLYYIGAGDMPHADYDVSGVIIVKSDNNASSAQVCGRLSTSANTMYLARYNTSGDVFQLNRVVAGVFTQIGSNGGGAVTVDDPHEMTLRLRGSLIQLLYDGAVICEATDTTITTPGRAGVRFSGAATSTAGVHLDRFMVVR